MLQRLEAPDRLAELLTRLEIVGGGGDGRFHDADGFGAKCGEADVEGGLDGVECVTGIDPHCRCIAQNEVRRALAVKRRVVAQADALDAWHHGEKSGTVASGSCRDQQQVGAGTVGDHGLAAGEAAVDFRYRLAACIGVGQHDDGFAGGDSGKPLLQKVMRSGIPGDGAGGTANQRRSDHSGSEIGLQQQSSAYGAHHQPGFLRAVAEAAVVFVDVERQHAEIGQRLPDLAAPAGGGIEDGAALLECVVLRDEALNRIRQCALVFVEVEVHVTAP